MESILDALNPTVDDIPTVWERFLLEFAQQFQDNQKQGRARNDIQKLRANERDIDNYIAKFEQLARDAGYTAGNNETVQLFLTGLPPPLLSEALKAPHPADYEALKEKVIEIAKARETFRTILGFQRGKAPQGQTTFDNQNTQRQPFFQKGNNQSNEPWRNAQGSQQRFNSSNAPRDYNNRPVPMDLDRAR